MPLHDYKCSCGKKDERFVKIKDLELPVLCECGQPMERMICAPMVRGDIPDYESPVTGEIIRGRAARRNDLARHNCVEWDAGMREANARKREAQAAAEEKSLEHALESTLAGFSPRKKELLEQEIRAGATVGVERTTPKPEQLIN